MTAKTTTKTSSESEAPQDGKQETTMNWLSRHLKSPLSRQNLRHDSYKAGYAERQSSPARPQTAPATGDFKTTVEDLPIELQRPVARPVNKPPPRPPRPDSSVVRDVSAWLDTSEKASPPLMGGLQYWREGAFATASEAPNVQYAAPIMRDHRDEKPATSHGQNLKSFCRRAKRMQVRMPSLLRTRSQRTAVHKQVNRRSNSMPLLAIPFETVEEGPRPVFIGRSKSLMHATSRPTTATTPIEAKGRFETCRKGSCQIQRRDSLACPRTSGVDSKTERRIHTAPLQEIVRIGDTTRPITAAAFLPREESMGNISDAPTYFSGLPPPSYRSRTQSILSTSSFGCIDGMNPEQRQISQQRAAQKSRRMKGKFRKLAQKAHFTK